MDFDRVRNVKNVFDNLVPGDKAEIGAQVIAVKGWLAEAFPALPDTDQASIAWFMAETLLGLQDFPLKHAGRAISDTASAYAVATVDLLGWGDQ